MVFSDEATSVRGELLQYATNILTGAVTRYSGFGFAGFCAVGMDTYGWKTDGLYKVGAETDNGALISAIIDFAASDFDTTQRAARRCVLRRDNGRQHAGQAHRRQRYRRDIPRTPTWERGAGEHAALEAAAGTGGYSCYR